MQSKILPVLLVVLLVLAAGGAWYMMKSEPDEGGGGSPSAFDSGVDEPSMETVERKEDDTDLVPEQPAPSRESTVPTAQAGPEAVLQGSVRGPDGSPLEGVEVTLFKFVYSQPGTSGRIRVSFTEDVLGTTRTGPDGIYRFESEFRGDEGPRAVTLRATKAGYVTAMKDHVGRGMVVDFELPRGATIRGKVLDLDDGKPVVGARVEGNLKVATDSLHTYVRWRDVATTDSEGRYELLGAPSGAFNLLVEHDDYEQFFVGNEQRLEATAGKVTEVADLRVRKGIVLDGLVVDESTGEPIRGAIVSVKEMPFMDSFRERTGQFGRFKMRGIKRGERDLQIVSEGYTTTAMRLDFNDEMSGKEQVFKIKPAGRASGFVYDSQGNPIPNAQVFVAENTVIFYKIRNYAEARTDAEGRYVVGNLDDGKRYRIVAHAPGLIPGSSPDFEAVAGEVVEGNVVQVEEGARVQGRVLDDAGVTIAGAVVSLDRPPFADCWFPPALGIGQMETLTVVTGDDGSFEFTGLYPGQYTASADHDDHVVVPEKRFRISSPSEAVNQEFAMARGRTISGRVTDPFGNPVAGATIEAGDASLVNSRFQATSDAEGAYVLRRLRDRPYRVRAYSDAAVATAQADVPADSSGIDFILRPYGTLSGRVVARNGDPVKSFKLKLLPLAGIEMKGNRIDLDDRMVQKQISQNEGGQEKSFVDRDGNFRLTGVIPGDYALEIEAENYRGTRRDRVTAEGGQDVRIPEIVLVPGARLEGRILASDGTPVDPGSVQVVLRAGPGTLITTKADGEVVSGRSTWPGKTTESEAKGVYSVGGLPAGRLEVRLRSQKYCVPETRIVTILDDGIVTEDFEVIRAGGALLKIQDEDGNPIPNAAVSQVLDSTGKPAVVDGARVNARGSVRGDLEIRKMVPGTYRLYVRKAGYETAEFDLTIGPGERAIDTVVMRKIN